MTFSDDVVDLKAITAALEERLVYEIYALKTMVQRLTGHNSNYYGYYEAPRIPFNAQQNSFHQNYPDPHRYTNYPVNPTHATFQNVQNNQINQQNQSIENITQPSPTSTTTETTTKAFIQPPSFPTSPIVQTATILPVKNQNQPNVKQLLKSMESKYLKNKNNSKVLQTVATTTSTTKTTTHRPKPMKTDDIRQGNSNSYKFDWKLENFTHNFKAHNIHELFSPTYKVKP